ncbi:MAG: hypothetical protein ACI9FD_004673 [Gammaproteobacteria bacterium]|jgi:hypothetical protein
MEVLQTTAKQNSWIWKPVLSVVGILLLITLGYMAYDLRSIGLAVFCISIVFFCQRIFSERWQVFF